MTFPITSSKILITLSGKSVRSSAVSLYSAMLICVNLRVEQEQKLEDHFAKTLSTNMQFRKRAYGACLATSLFIFSFTKPWQKLQTFSYLPAFRTHASNTSPTPHNSNSNLAIISHKDCLLHNVPYHPESPQRLSQIMNALQKTPAITEQSTFDTFFSHLQALPRATPSLKNKTSTRTRKFASHSKAVCTSNKQRQKKCVFFLPTNRNKRPARLTIFPIGTYPKTCRINPWKIRKITIYWSIHDN